MERLEHELDTTLGATVDLLLAAFGLAIVFYPAVTLGNALLGDPLGSRETLALAVLAVGGAYPYVAGDWSLGRLGDYVFAFVACIVLVLPLLVLTGGVVVLALDLPLSWSAGPRLALYGVAYALAYGLVYRGWYAGMKRAI